jgi:hypothetical protein
MKGLLIIMMTIFVSTITYGSDRGNTEPVETTSIEIDTISERTAFFHDEDSEVIYTIKFPYVHEEEIIEWETYSITRDVCGMSGCAVMHYDTCNQYGTKYKVKYIEVEYKDKTLRLELETVKIETVEVLERKITCDNYTLNEYN